MTEKTQNGVPQDAPEVIRLQRQAGAAYGLVFGLTVALLTWGYDGLQLARWNADLSWAKLLLSLPASLLIGCLVGWLSTLISLVPVTLLLWGAYGGLLGLLAGHLPFAGMDLAAWLADSRLWGKEIFPYGPAAEVNTSILVIVGAGISIMAGFFQGMATDWAWNQATEARKMSIGSWLALLVSLPWVLLFSGATEGQIHQAARASQESVSEVLELALDWDNQDPLLAREVRAFDAYAESLSPEYTVHLANYDIQTLASSNTDVVFSDGLTLRCSTTEVGMASLTTDHRVLTCSNFSQELDQRMGQLVYAGMYGERLWLNDRWQQFSVQGPVLLWLKEHGDQFSRTFEVIPAGQRGGWIFLTARFESGFEMTCRFQGMLPIHVDHCEDTTPDPA